VVVRFDNNNKNLKIGRDFIAEVGLLRKVITFAIVNTFTKNGSWYKGKSFCWYFGL